MKPAEFKEKFKDVLSEYQDIELINFVGVGRSHEEWSIIKDWVDWRGKRVADLSCFYGYFSFKVAECGGIVTGFDTNYVILGVARALKESYNSPVEFALWRSGEAISYKYDIVLCLDCFQYYKNKEETLQNIMNKTVIFDVENNTVPLISKYYNIVRQQRSPRFGEIDDKVILLCLRK